MTLDGMGAGHPVYSRHRWQQVRARRLELDGWTCQMPYCDCPTGRAIDPDAPARSRWSASVDHVHVLLEHGDPYDLDNLRAAHLRCNVLRARARQRARNRAGRRRYSTGRSW